MYKNAFGFLVLCVGLCVLGCGGDSSACTEGQFLCDDMCIDECGVDEVECDCVCIPEIEPVLADIQVSVFDVSCTASSCHGGPNPREMLDLSTAELSEATLIDVPSNQVAKDRVTPGDVSASYLYNKLTGQDIAQGTDPMPQLGFPLCEAKISAVETWIAAGAP